MEPITRRAALGAALAVPAAAALAGTARAAGPTEIELFFPVPVQGMLANKMRELVDRFNAAHADIKATAVYTGSYDDTNLKTRAAIKAGKPPAAVIMSANFVREYVINDEVDPFDPLIEKAGKTPDAFMDEFWPALKPNAVIGGASTASRSRIRHRCCTTMSRPSPRLVSIPTIRRPAGPIGSLRQRSWPRPKADRRSAGA